jgi:hypothetical protein
LAPAWSVRANSSGVVTGRSPSELAYCDHVMVGKTRIDPHAAQRWNLFGTSCERKSNVAVPYQKIHM